MYHGVRGKRVGIKFFGKFGVLCFVVTIVLRLVFLKSKELNFKTLKTPPKREATQL